MNTMTSAEIRAEVAAREGCDTDCVKCFNCQYWGYNRGKTMTSMGESRCTARKTERTRASQFCRKFKWTYNKNQKRG